MDIPSLFYLKNYKIAEKVMKMIREIYPQANIVAIDYDPGASEVNQKQILYLLIMLKDKKVMKTNRINLMVY